MRTDCNTRPTHLLAALDHQIAEVEALTVAASENDSVTCSERRTRQVAH